MRPINLKRLEHIRSIIQKDLEDFKPPYIHPTAYIHFSHVFLGVNHIIGPHVTIGWIGIGAELDEDGHIVRFPQSGFVKLGDDVVICANAVIDRATDKKKTSLTKIGDRCIIGPKAHVCHNVRVGEDTLVLGDAVICGGAIIGKRCMIGANSTIKNKAKVGDDVIIGMGAVVTKDVPDGVTVKGNPGRWKE